MASAVLVAHQINRLKSRFGDRAFDDEFVRLAQAEFMSMADGNVVRAVDVWIGNRPHNRPPLLADFREARLSEVKVKEKYGIQGLSDLSRATASNRGLQAYLAKAFPGCKTLAEAIEVRKLQIRIARAENPNYDPMKDQEWMRE